MGDDLKRFYEARDFLLGVASYEEAVRGFSWPKIERFNWALDYFDDMARGNDEPALIYVDSAGIEQTTSFDEMRRRSNQVANFLRAKGLEKGDRVMMMMDLAPEIAEIMLGIMKAGGAIIPAATLLSTQDIGDRITRGEVRFLFCHGEFVARASKAGEALEGLRAKICVPNLDGDCNGTEGWTPYAEVDRFGRDFEPSFPTEATDDLFLFFTSGTTAQPKLVMHSHVYPVGHLTTMYWIGAKPGDIHYNISAPGWAKFAWSSFFGPWNAGATIFMFRQPRFAAPDVLSMMEKHRVTSLCAPLSVWKLFLVEDLSKYDFALRTMVSAGEPLNPEIIRRAKEGTGVDLREGFGQTETTALIGTFPGIEPREGAMGLVAPGYRVAILDDELNEVPPGTDGQIAVATGPVRPLGLLQGYDDERRNAEIFVGGWYLTGDTASMDEDGFVHFVGRVDDVFKSLDYRISPFEVESEIIRYEAVLEVAVIPSRDERDRLVPKAYIVLKEGFTPARETALALFRFIREGMAPYKRPRMIEFLEAFPKTISAKVKRKDLRAIDRETKASGQRGRWEFYEADFAEELDLRR